MSSGGQGATVAAPEANPRLTNTDEVLYRQIHPDLYLNGSLSSSAFQPTATDKRQLSVDRSSITGPAAAFALYVRNGLKSRAVYGVSVGQFETQGIQCHSDPLFATGAMAANPAHAYADYTTITASKDEKKKAQRLRDRAVERGRLHPPA